MSEPSPFVVVNVGQKNEESKIVVDSTEPRWEQGFRFLVHDPNFQTVDFKIMDSKTDKCLGELSYPLKNLLSAPDMEVDRFFSLKKAEANSELSVRLSLRVLTTERSENWKDESENLMTKPIPDAKETDLDEASAKDSGKSSSPGQQHQQPSSPGSKAPSSGPVSSSTSPAPQPEQIIPAATSKLKETNPQLVQRKKTSPSVSSSDSKQGEYGCGKIQLTLRYSMQRGKLIVCIHKCVSLLACDKDNFSDPYVKAYLLPDKSSKKKTKVINNNLNPVFDETFEYEVTPQELAKSTLDITVKNDTSLFSSSQKELGTVQIDMSKMDTSKASTEWYDLQPGEDHKQKKETDI